jgi:tetratricopeptide (TPR) repeat protein
LVGGDDAVLTADARHFEAVYHLGLDRLQQGQFAEAEQLFRRALDIDEYSAEAHHHLAIALTGMQRVEEAIPQYEKALALRPAHPEAHNNLGYAFGLIRRYKEAAWHYEKALAIKPGYAEAHNNLGNAFAALGRTEEAVAQYERALAVQPDYGDARENLVQALVALRFDPCGALEKAPGLLAPKDAKFFVTLGNVYWRRSEGELAASAFRAAKALEPNSVEVSFALARMLGKVGREIEAAALLEGLIERGAGRLEALVRLAALPVSAHRIDLVSELNQAIQHIREDEHRIRVAFALASALDKAGRYSEAWQTLVPANRAIFAAMKAELGGWAERQCANLASLRAYFPSALHIDMNGTPISLFILGTGGSGKSTMEKLVGQLDGVKPGYENPSVDYPLYRTLEMGGMPIDDFVDRLPVELHSTFGENYREELARRAGSAKVFSNTNAQLVHRAVLIATTCPNVRFLLVKRNLEDTVLRIYMSDLRLNPQSYDLRAARDYVVWYHQMIDLLAQKFSQIARVVHYEDMIADPAGTLRTAAEWLGLPNPEGSLPVLGDDRGCAQPYRTFMAATLDTQLLAGDGASDRTDKSAAAR